jgi:hypothetical protein
MKKQIYVDNHLFKWKWKEKQLEGWFWVKNWPQNHPSLVDEQRNKLGLSGRGGCETILINLLSYIPISLQYPYFIAIYTDTVDRGTIPIYEDSRLKSSYAWQNSMD